METENTKKTGQSEARKPSGTEQADSRELQKHAALADFTKRTQRAIAVIVILVGVPGAISMTILLNRAIHPQPRNSQHELDRALYDATVDYLRKEERQKAVLESEAKHDPKGSAAKLTEQTARVRQAREMVAALAKKIGVSPRAEPQMERELGGKSGTPMESP